MLLEHYSKPRVLSEITNQQPSIREQSSIVNRQFSISATGPGITQDEMDKLFEVFGQTKTGRQAQEGTGLGLPISRKFVQLMGGHPFRGRFFIIAPGTGAGNPLLGGVGVGR